MGRDNREGGLGNLEKQPGKTTEQSEIEQCPFFVDPPGTSTQGSTAYAPTEYFFYDRCNVAVLGTDGQAEDSEGTDR